MQCIYYTWKYSTSENDILSKYNLEVFSFVKNIYNILKIYNYGRISLLNFIIAKRNIRRVFNYFYVHTHVSLEDIHFVLAKK